MAQIALNIPQVGQLNSTEDPKVAGNFNVLQALVNGNIDLTNLSAALQAQLVGVPPGSVTGHTNIAASESRTNTAYGTLTTPDQVAGIVLPANGLLVVWYQATWQESVNNAAAADIFLNGVEVQAALATGGSPLSFPAFINGGAGNVNKNVPLATIGFGLSSLSGAAFGSPYTGDVTTGQIVGGGPAPISYGASDFSLAQAGPCYIFAAAGTYTVSIRFKASSGTVTASNRKLWVEAKSFS